MSTLPSGINVRILFFGTVHTWIFFSPVESRGCQLRVMSGWSNAFFIVRIITYTVLYGSVIVNLLNDNGRSRIIVTSTISYRV